MANEKELEQLLSQLHFTPNETAVYLALFDVGQGKAGDIIKKTGFHRNIIYRALDELIARKLVHKISKRGVFYYEPATPKPLIEEAQKQQEIATIVAKELSNRKAQAKSEVYVLSDKDGVEDLFNTVLAEGEDLYLLGANALALKRYPDIFEKFERRRIKKGITRHHLSTQATRGLHFNDLPNTTAKYLPKEFSSPMVIWIFGNKVAQALWENTETIFLIENKALADDYRRYFRLLWNQNVTTFSGKDSPKYAFGDILDTLQPGDTLYIMGAYEFNPAFRKVVLDFHALRVQRKIKAHILFNEDAKQLQTAFSNMPYTEARQMEKGVFTPAVFLLYGNKTLISLGNEFSFFQIESNTATQAFKVYFELLWKKANK